MKSPIVLAATLSLCALLSTQTGSAVSRKDDSSIDRGRYLIKIAGCNDCHTAGYGPAKGAVPESQWLLGDSVGWRGPRGTTYPINLRLFLSRLTEDQWVSTVQTARAMPPMPWYVLHEMDEQDLRDMYAYIRSLPVAGEEAPAFVDPEQAPAAPYFTLVVPD